MEPIYEGIPPVPDRGFIRKLKEIDPRLDCEFNRQYGKFVITCKAELSGRYELFLVEDGLDGGFRYPDNRDIISIHMADRYQKSRRQRILEGEEYMKNYRAKEDKRVKDAIHDMTKDDKRQLVRTYTKAANLGKAESTFRKVNVMPKGKVERRDGFTIVDKTAVNG